MDIIRIPLRGHKYPGHHATIDANDYELVSQYEWRTIQGGKTNILYAVTAVYVGNGKNRTLAMHQLLQPVPKNMVVDHINHDGLDNRRANLRPATRLQNLWNQKKRKNNTSGYRGVSPLYTKWNTPTRWRASIKVNGSRRYFGCHTTPEEAAHAYDAAAKELFGDFACLNFPD